MPIHILSCEGPDHYARASRLATRMAGVGQALAKAGDETHLWFVGDPYLPGHETQEQLHFHRWCHGLAVIIPLASMTARRASVRIMRPRCRRFCSRKHSSRIWVRGGRAVILAEEWHTVDAILHIDWLLRRARVRPQVTILWHANHTYASDPIPWGRLAEAAIITTVSRYMIVPL
jgi:hypothetical protein